MFLDEELNKIHEEGGFCEETSVKLIQACFNRLPKPEDLTSRDYINEIKKIEGSWRLFCKSHVEYNPDGFRIATMFTGGAVGKPIYKALNWI